MGFFDRLSRLVRANANAAVSSMEDPAKILDQSVADTVSYTHLTLPTICSV